jgi:hypothetical protein
VVLHLLPEFMTCPSRCAITVCPNSRLTNMLLLTRRQGGLIKKAAPSASSNGGVVPADGDRPIFKVWCYVSSCYAICCSTFLSACLSSHLCQAPEAIHKKGGSVLGLDRLAQEKRAAKEKEEASAKRARMSIQGMCRFWVTCTRYPVVGFFHS